MGHREHAARNFVSGLALTTNARSNRLANRYICIGARLPVRFVDASMLMDCDTYSTCNRGTTALQVRSLYVDRDDVQKWDFSCLSFFVLYWVERQGYRAFCEFIVITERSRTTCNQRR